MCFQSVQVRKRDSLWPHTKFHIIRLLSVWSSTSSVCSLSFGKLKLFEIPIYSAWVSPGQLEWNFTSRSSDWQLSQMMTQRHGLNAVGLYRCTHASRVVTRIDTSVLMPTLGYRHQTVFNISLGEPCLFLETFCGNSGIGIKYLNFSIVTTPQSKISIFVLYPDDVAIFVSVYEQHKY